MSDGSGGVGDGDGAGGGDERDVRVRTPDGEAWQVMSGEGGRTDGRHKCIVPPKGTCASSAVWRERIIICITYLI